MSQHYDIQWLTNELESGNTFKFIYFWGHTNKYNEAAGKFCFSQWHESPFTVEGTVYKTAEHWMMAQKALLFNDVEIFNKIVAATKPGEVKELGDRLKILRNKPG